MSDNVSKQIYLGFFKGIKYSTTEPFGGGRASGTNDKAGSISLVSFNKQSKLKFEINIKI